MSSNGKKFIIGIDIGTTSAKVSVLDTTSDKIIANACDPYPFGDHDRGKKPNHEQQSVKTLINSVEKCITEITKRSISLKDVAVISICGQMHGCVLWEKGAYSYCGRTQKFEINSELVSDLFTWLDQRCTPQFLKDLPKPDSYVDSISSGFGCATIFWFQKNKPNDIKQFTCSGTIMDFLVTVLCNLERPIISNHNANGWGYFDPIENSWNKQILKSYGFPIGLLPDVTKVGKIAGNTSVNWLGIEANTPVMVAFGDFQCSCYAILRKDDSPAVLNIGTSMQLSLLMPKDYIPPKKLESLYKSIDYFPYFGDRYVAVAASLNGGNVLHSLVNILKNIIEQIGNVEQIDEQIIWNKLFELSNADRNSDLQINTTLFGERHDTQRRASIHNITASIEIGHIMEATCKGLIDNIFKMMPIEFIIENQVKQDEEPMKLIGTGSALQRNQVLKRILETKLNNSAVKCEVKFIEGNGADVGACYVAKDYMF